MKELILRPSRWQATLLAAVSGLFFAGGIFMVRDGARGGWFVLLFFGLCLVVGLVQMLPGAANLRLTDTGFSVRSLFRTQSYQWDDVAAFGVGVIAGHRRVLFDFADSYTHKPRGRALAMALAGAEGALPDNYGRTAEELAELLTNWKQGVRTLDA